MSDATSSKLASRPSLSSASTLPVSDSFRIDLDRVLSDLWTSRTFALGFLGWLFAGAAGWVSGGVADTRPGVDAAIRATGAALQRELAKRKTGIRLRECPR